MTWIELRRGEHDAERNNDLELNVIHVDTVRQLWLAFLAVCRSNGITFDINHDLDKKIFVLQYINGKLNLFTLKD